MMGPTVVESLEGCCLLCNSGLAIRRLVLVQNTLAGGLVELLGSEHHGCCGLVLVA